MTNLAQQFDLITIDEIADALKMSKAHVADVVTRDKKYGFPGPYRVGRSRRWDRKEVVNWIKQCKANKKCK